jgi:hypothetical protein
MTTLPPDAPHRPPTTTVGALEGAAEGVESVVRPEPLRPDGRHPVAWLHVVAPPSWQAVPTARSRCECGWDIRAIGRRRVLALIADHDAHRDACPLRTAAETGRRRAA